MELTIVQLNPAWEAPSANFKKVDQLLANSQPTAGGLIILPEMFSTGFSLDLSKTCAGGALETERYLRALAMKHRAAVIAGTVRAGSDGMGRNEALTFSSTGEILARYVKQRPFSGGGEDLAHERGYKGVTFAWAGLQVATLICYDLRFPELFRAGSKGGVEVFVVIAAWPKDRIEHWITLLRARAIENQAFVVGVNRTGNDPKHQYCGRSIVVDPRGSILADAGEEECVLSATVDAKVVQSWREDFPAYRDFLRWS
jgi:omega-amidase